MDHFQAISHLATDGRLLYSQAAVAEILSLSIHTVKRDVRLGRIDTRRYGRRILVPRSEVERIAAEGMRLA
jgi:predicted site-specific integrase-resolvase